MLLVLRLQERKRQDRKRAYVVTKAVVAGCDVAAELRSSMRPHEQRRHTILRKTWQAEGDALAGGLREARWCIFQECRHMRRRGAKTHQ
jgi:hypothetical protein